ncbi:hypothetical protein AM305_01594 [Actinobacillus minor NM305]|uniref:Uncharacterized protein n=1 Tax=Actinobacillus minor NM305 TaxID=637911 RepID=C5S1U7_9PAST|nr:hypothetical protein AM305_01594 [Actinobacillus minor NM305]
MFANFVTKKPACLSGFRLILFRFLATNTRTMLAHNGNNGGNRHHCKTVHSFSLNKA